MGSKIDRHFMRFAVDSARIENEDGGEGSGNHHHAGRPGQVGGSAPSGNGTAEASKAPKNTGKRVEVDRSTIPTLKNFHKVESRAAGNTSWRMSELRDEWDGNPEQQAAFDKFEKSIPEWNKGMSEAFDKFDFSTRADDEGIIGILNDGKIKTQMETGDSNGYYDPDTRKKISKDLFGTTGAGRAEYEVYGFLDNAMSANHYGGYRIVLDKDKVFNRTTFTIGDSLDATPFHDVYPSSVNDPHVEWNMTQDFSDRHPSAWNTYGLHEKDMEGIQKTGGTPLGGVDGYGYVELQFHGGITLDDIAYIEMVEGTREYKARKKEEVAELAKQKGVEVRWVKPNIA